MMGTAFTGALVRRVKRFFILNTSSDIIRLIHSLEAYYGDVWSCLDINNIISSVLKEPWIEGAKRFILAFKASVNCPKALVGVVSRFKRALPFLRIGSLIPKRFRIYSLASNYIRPVRTIHLSTSNYTFNYCHRYGDTVKGEIRKNMLPNRGTRIHNKLAPKFRNFSTNVAQTGALVPGKTDKSEHPSLTSNSTFNKTCEVSLDAILFIERMNKIEDHRSTLYKVAFSTDSLLVAYNQIKSKLGNLTPGQGMEMLKGINLKWFRTTSNKLLKGLFVYPKVCRVSIPKKPGSIDSRLLTLTSPRIKIIERSILNALEPVFEGKFEWKKIDKSEYYFIKNNSSDTTVTINKSGYFKKNWTNLPVFSRFSFGFSPSKSAHGALHVIKSWPTNVNWFIKFDIVKAFDTINRNRLKNIFLKNCPDHRI
jgi:hypothetical protein